MLEGGGQILRISTALSCILGKPITVNKIRAKRKDGGLKAQHLTGIKLVAEMANGRLDGGALASKEIALWPNQIKSGRFAGDTQTAGSLCLLLQVSIPCCLFADGIIKLDLRGGTNAEHAPPIDFYELVFCPIVKQLGIQFECEILRRGYYPKGGGELHVTTNPIKQLTPIQLTEFGTIKRIFGKSYVAGFLPTKIAERMAKAAQGLLKSKYRDVAIDINVMKESDKIAYGEGAGIILVAETTTGCLLGSSALGKKGLPAEDVAKEAVDSLVEDLDCQACVDKYMQDQLIIFMALANGCSKIKCGPLTLHTQTAIKVTEIMTGVNFKVSPASGSVGNDAFFIECEGIAHKNPYLT